MSKHKVNKISGYYEGPDSVFYDKKHDEIFVLEHTGIRLMSKDFVDKGPLFFYSTINDRKSKRKIAMTGMTYIERLGDL